MQGRILQRRGARLVVVPREVFEATFVPRPTLFFAGWCLTAVLAVVLAVLVFLIEEDFLATRPLLAPFRSEAAFRDAAAVFFTGFLPAGVLTLVPSLVPDFLPTGILRPAVVLPDPAFLPTGVLCAGAFPAMAFFAGRLLATFLAFCFRATVLSSAAFLRAGDLPATFLPEDFDVEGGVGFGRRLVTTVRSPGPGMRLVSPPVSHRTVSMAPLTAVTTPVRGVPVVDTSIRVPTSAISISSLGPVAQQLTVEKVGAIRLNVLDAQ